MNFDDNFRRIGNANIDAIKAIVAEIESQQWEADTDFDMQYVFLVHDRDLRHTEPTRRPALNTFEPVLRPILDITADFFDKSPQGQILTKENGVGYFIRAYLARLLPGETIAEHRDLGFSYAHSHNVHVPIVMNERVQITVGGETLTIPEGEIYEINNRRPHAITNAGEDPHIHLSLDYVLKGEMCCCGEKLHHGEPCTPEACFGTDTGEVSCTGCFT